ncbi:MAG: hypothetical protein ACXVI7_05825 [Halobacteriota archaeon]
MNIRVDDPYTQTVKIDNLEVSEVVTRAQRSAHGRSRGARKPGSGPVEYARRSTRSLSEAIEASTFIDFRIHGRF